MPLREMPLYFVKCYAKACQHEAAFKIAGRWSDGVTQELKTYSLSCPECLSKLFAEAGVKKAACRLAPGESLGDPEIFELTRGERDQQRIRRPDLESGE